MRHPYASIKRRAQATAEGRRPPRGEIELQPASAAGAPVKIFTKRRVRHAGIAAIGSESPKDDDLSPETLLEDPALDPVPQPAQDSVLHGVDASQAGMGTGLDEAEQAERDPVGLRHSRQLERKSKAHAADPNFFEPAEAEMRRQMRVDRQR